MCARERATIRRSNAARARGVNMADETANVSKRLRANFQLGDYVVDCLADGCGWHVEGPTVRVLRADVLEHVRETGHRDDIAVVRTGPVTIQGA